MKVRQSKMRNYGSFHGEHTFVWSGRGLVLIDGLNRTDAGTVSNASGKSSLVESLEWCWFGEVPRDDSADSVVNEEAGKDCYVDNTVEDEDGRLIRIYRYRKEDRKSGVRLYVDGEDKTSLDARITQAEINKLLGMDRTVFRSAIMFAQFGRTNFAEAANAERVDILTKILQLGEIDVWSARAKQLREEARTRTVNLQVNNDRIAANFSATARLLDEYEEQTSKWELDRQARLDGLAQSRVEVEKYLADTEPLVGGLPHDEEALRTEMAHEPRRSGEYEEVSQAREQAVQEHARILGEATALDRMRSVIANDIRRFTALQAGTCSACGQEITAGHLHTEIEARQVKVGEYVTGADAHRAAAQVVQVKADECLQRMQAIDLEHQKATQAHTEKILALRHAVDAAQAAAGYVAKARESLAQLDRDVEGWRAAGNPYVEKVDKVRRERKGLEIEADELRVALTQWREREEALEYWVKACGPKGIKNYVLDARLADLNSAINHWVGMLTGGTIWVEIVTHGVTSSKSVSNKIDVKVFRYNATGTVTERGYRSWSGGEKGKVALGIDFGLASLVAKRATKRFDILVLDELFRHLDRAGKEAVVDMLKSLRQEKSSIFVVEHDADFADAFENRVLVVKEGGRSRIEGDTNGLEPEHEATQQSPTKKRRRVPTRTPVRAP